MPVRRLRWARSVASRAEGSVGDAAEEARLMQGGRKAMERSHITCKMAAEVAADAAVDAAAKTQTAHLAQAQARNLLSSRPLSLLSVVQRENTACSSIFKMNAHQPSRCRDLVKFNRTIPVLYQNKVQPNKQARNHLPHGLYCLQRVHTASSIIST